MRNLLMTSVALVAFSAPVLGRDVAFIVGNEDYESLGNMRRGDEVVDAVDAFSDLGFAVFAGEDVSGGDLVQMLTSFVRESVDAERVLVILSGRFMHSVNDSWLLGVDSSSVPSLGAMPGDAVPLSTVLAVLAAHPGKALLLIADDNESGETDSPYLSRGIGELEIPAGVTIFRGGARSVAGFAADVLPLPALSKTVQAARRQGLATDGYLPRDFRFLEGVEAVEVETSVANDEQGIWDAARLSDTQPAYENYLRRFPEGSHAVAATKFIDEIKNEPFRASRLQEEALGMARDQRKEIQRNLSILGIDPRGIDGIFGPGSRAAIRKWQSENGAVGTGYMTRDQISRLASQGERRAAELEAEAERLRLEQERLDRAFWQGSGAAGDEIGLRIYLKRYPDGVFAEVAQNRLEVFEKAKRAEAAEKERAVWDETSQLGTLAAYRSYLAAFPKGAFVDEAKAKIDALSVDPAEAKALADAKRAEERLGLNGQTRGLVENRLKSLGLKPGPVDGKFDDRTRRAIRRYQTARKLPVTGYLTQTTVVRLLADSIFR